jgi:glutamate N-acetyltransferase/amino-acid N-acetyltransferase
MSEQVPLGFSFAGVHCGLKRDPSRQDISLVLSDRPCVAAGVYTQNRVVAAPVLLNRQRTPSSCIRAVVTNSGNANACTGQGGLDDARRMAALAAAALGVGESDVLVLSTGIIGERLPMSKIEQGIQQAARQLGHDVTALTAAARGMMTTDSHHKIASQRIDGPDGNIAILGLAKGAAMIGPNMATMLAIVVTDAPLGEHTAQDLLRAAVDQSFNCISVDGHTSTNDTVLLLANGAAGGQALQGDPLDRFATSLNEVCLSLAKAIPGDGEGATHLIEVLVDACATREDARRIAKSIADSPLVKTAIAGADPNWGRIVSAAGYAGVPFDPATVQLRLNDFLLYERGTPVPFEAAAVSESIRQNRTTRIDFRLGQGEQSVRFWSCDLTAEYVRLNADYHT